MISVEVKESGLCLIRGLGEYASHMSASTYIRPIKAQPEVYWTGWRWLGHLKRGFKAEVLPITLGRENLEALVCHTKSVLALKKYQQLDDFFFKLGDLQLWPWQITGGRVLAAASRMYLADDVGLGKSFTLLSALCRKAMDTGSFPRTLILCPASVKYQWHEEANRVLGPEVKISVVDGTKLERRQAWEEDAGIYITNYESFARDWQKQERIARATFDALVLDEAWKVKNWRTKGCRTVAEFARTIPLRYALNATPVTNRYEDLYGVFSVLDPLLFLSWRNFQIRYMEIRLMRTGRNSQWGKEIVWPKLIGYKKVQEIRDLIAPHFLRRTAEDLLQDRPLITVAWYWVDLHSEQHKRYEEVLRQKDVNPLARTVNLRMATLLGAPPGENPKSQELAGLLENTLRGRSVVVFSESVEYLESLWQDLQRSKIKAIIIQGRDSPSWRARKQTAFNHKYVNVLLTTSAGESGLNLQIADFVVNLDLPWSPARIQQRVGRVRPYLGGKERTVSIINILARGTIEEKVVRRVRRKLGDISRLFHGQIDPAVEAIFEPEELVRDGED